MKALFASVAIVAMLGACSPANTPATVVATINTLNTQVTSNIQVLAATSMPTILNALKPVLSAGQLATITNDVAMVTAAAAVLKGQPSVAANDTNAQNVVTAVQDILNVAATIPTPPMPADAAAAIAAADLLFTPVATAVQIVAAQVQATVTK